MTLDEFKTLVVNDNEVKKNICGQADVIDMDNGTMIIHSDSVKKYLEKYSCKDENDLSDTLWYSYGVFVKIVD